MKPNQPKATTGTAYHEAGHAVVRALLGLSVRKVTVKPTEDTLGHVAGAPLPQWLCRVVEVDDPWDHAWALRKILNEITSMYAGALAERLKTRRALNVDGAYYDHRQIADFAITVTPESHPKEMQALCAWLELRASRLLREHWKAVEAVAQALLEKRTLTGNQVLTAIAEADPSAIGSRPLSPTERADRDRAIAGHLGYLSDDAADRVITTMPPAERRAYLRVRQKLQTARTVR